jgi:thioredoxin-like negative regulator of GroEL
MKLNDNLTPIQVCHIDELKSIISSNKHEYYVLYITADWCAVCKRVFPYILKHLEEKKTINIVADYDRAKTITHKFRIQAIPTLIRFYDNEVDSICMSGSLLEIDKFFNEF